MKTPDSAIISYFGEAAVNSAITDYYIRNGITIEVRDQLTRMVIRDVDQFFQLVADYVEGNV